MDERRRGLLSAAEAASVLLLAFLQWMAVQLSCQPLSEVFEVEPVCAVTEACLLFFIDCAIALVSGRFFIGFSVTLPFAVLYGIIGYYVIEYHGMPLTFGELGNLGTAMNVIGGYSIKIFPNVIYILIIAAVSAFLIFVTAKAEEGRERYSLSRVFSSAAPLLFSALVLWSGLFSPNSAKPKDAVTWAWYMSYGKYGALSCVLEEAIESLDPLKMPDGYSADAAAEAARGYDSDEAAEKDELPDIIFILNETFFDLSDIADMELDADPLASLRAREDITWGRAVVPLVKGGTNCSEYELLTGNSVCLINGTTPFNTLDMKDSEGTATRLSALGYETLAAHSESGSNYNRTKGYPGLGFDTVHFGSDFTDTERYGGRPHCTDESLYRNFISWYDGMGEGQRFAYLLTIQNHGEYDQGDDSFDLVHVKNCADPDLASRMNEYLTSMKLSSDAFSDLLDRLAESERKVVLCLVGDHCPNFARELASGEDGAPEKELALRSTPYLIWSNFGLDMSELPARLNLFALSSHVMKAAGLPLSGYEKFLCDLSQDYIFLPSGDCFTSDGGCIPFSGNENLPSRLRGYLALEYNNINGKNDRIDGFFRVKK